MAAVPGSRFRDGPGAVAVQAPGPATRALGRARQAPPLDRDGGFVVAYRVRVIDQRGAATVVAQSAAARR